MTTFNDIHNEAMDATFYALRARRRGDDGVAQALFTKALKLELAALDVMGDVGEPIYSMTYRSAATLALDCKDFRLAEKLASKALAGDPPSDLAWELREVLEQAMLQGHLRLDGIELAEDELQMSLAGAKIGPGLAPIGDFVGRVNGMRKLILKVWNYVNAQEQSENGSPESRRSVSPDIFISPIRTGSVAVTLKVGGPSQTGLMQVGGGGVVGPTLDAIETVATSDVEELAAAYPEDTYRRELVRLVRDIAPDGVKVAQVGFTAVSAGNERTFPLTTTKKELSGLNQRTTPEERVETVTGALLFVDGTRTNNLSIQIVQPGGAKRRIKVPVGMMDDIVRPLWGKAVTAECMVRGKTATLVRIRGLGVRRKRSQAGNMVRRGSSRFRRPPSR